VKILPQPKTQLLPGKSFPRDNISQIYKQKYIRRHNGDGLANYSLYKKACHFAREKFDL
jgi:hypothetical protein